MELKQWLLVELGEEGNPEMSDYLYDELGFPLTSVQTLRRMHGYRPNSGAEGVNYERGDRGAMEEQFPRSNRPELDREYLDALFWNWMWDQTFVSGDPQSESNRRQRDYLAGREEYLGDIADVEWKERV